MNRRSPWLDPADIRVAVGLAVLAALLNGVWVLLDNGAPSWDQAHYLSTTLEYKAALDGGGPIDLLRSIHSTDPAHGPLFTVLLLPFFYVFGASATSAMALNVAIAPVLYLSAGQIAWIVFRRWQARLLTIFLLATMPVLVGLLHNALQDFLLVTLTSLSLLLLLQSEGFRRRWTTWGMAAAMGLGILTKVTFPLFVAGPLLVVLARRLGELLAARRRDGTLPELRPLALNLGGAAAIFLLIALPWYAPNLAPTLDYVRSTTSGPLSEGAGPSNPYTFHAVASFTTGVVNFNLSWVILLAGLVAVGLGFARVRALFRPRPRPEPLWKLGFLLAWAVIPYLSVAFAHNQDVRLMAPAFPAVAILVAGAIVAVPQPRARLALAAFAVLALTYQTVNHVTDITPGFMPDRARIAAGDYEALVTLDSAPINYERLPGPDLATPVLEYVDGVSRTLPGGPEAPRSVCLLESEALININTLTFLSTVRGDPFLFGDAVKEPGGTERDLEVLLSGCQFAIYVRQPELSPADAETRLAIYNRPYAANYMTPRLFSLFRGPSRSFPLTAEPGSEPEATPLGARGGNRARVLTRTPGEGVIAE